MLRHFGLPKNVIVIQDDIKSDIDLMKVLKSLRLEREVFQDVYKKYLAGKSVQKSTHKD